MLDHFISTQWTLAISRNSIVSMEQVSRQVPIQWQQNCISMRNSFDFLFKPLLVCEFFIKLHAHARPMREVVLRWDGPNLKASMKRPNPRIFIEVGFPVDLTLNWLKCAAGSMLQSSLEDGLTEWMTTTSPQFRDPSCGKPIVEGSWHGLARLKKTIGQLARERGIYLEKKCMACQLFHRN